MHKGITDLNLVDNMQNEQSGTNEDEKQEVSEIIFKEETCWSIAKRKTKFFFQNITLEPVMLFYGVIRSIDRVAQSQLIIGKKNRLSVIFYGSREFSILNLN